MEKAPVTSQSLGTGGRRHRDTGQCGALVLRAAGGAPAALGRDGPRDPSDAAPSKAIQVRH